MYKLLFAIKTTKKYQHRIDTILDTWLKNIDDYIFYSDHEDPEKNVVLASQDTSYLSGTLSKTLWFFNNLNKIFVEDNKTVLEEYDYIFFVDDDTYVNVNNLKQFLNTIDKKSVYGHMFTPQKNIENPIWNLYKNILKETDSYHSGGAGYIIPTNILKSVEFVDLGIVFDDAAIGINLIRNGVNLVHDERFNPENPEFYHRDNFDIINKITYHHISPSKMLELHKIVLENTI